MNDLSFFNLGFKSDRVFEALKSDKESLANFPSIIHDALTILEDCLTIEHQASLVSNLSGKTGQNFSVIAPVLWQIFPSKNIDEVVKELKSLLRTLSELSNGSKTDQPEGLDHAITFFSKLTDIALSNSADSFLTTDFILSYA